MQSLQVVSLNIWHIVLSLANLLLLFLILKKFLFKPVTKVLEERRKEIDRVYAQADEAQKIADGNRERYEAIMESAGQEADAVIRDASERAERRASQVLTEAQEKAERDRIDRIERLKKAGLAETLYKRCTFDQDDGRNNAQTEAAMRYVDHFKDAYSENIGLMIYGSLGAGKTFLAGCIANELLNRGISVKMTSLQRLIEAANADYGDGRENVLDEVANVSLLILDDFGMERHTEYMNEQIYEIINTRYKAQLPLIITTNLDKEDLENCDNLERKRIYDRINEMCLFMKFNGASRRPEIKASKKALAAKIFGGAA